MHAAKHVCVSAAPAPAQRLQVAEPSYFYVRLHRRHGTTDRILPGDEIKARALARGVCWERARGPGDEGWGGSQDTKAGHKQYLPAVATHPPVGALRVVVAPACLQQCSGPQPRCSSKRGPFQVLPSARGWVTAGAGTHPAPGRSRNAAWLPPPSTPAHCRCAACTRTPQAWAARLAPLAPLVAGPIYYLWGTDWEDAPVKNAQALAAALPAELRYDHKAAVAASAAKRPGSLMAFLQRPAKKVGGQVAGPCVPVAARARAWGVAEQLARSCGGEQISNTRWTSSLCTHQGCGHSTQAPCSRSAHAAPDVLGCCRCMHASSHCGVCWWSAGSHGS